MTFFDAGTRPAPSAPPTSHRLVGGATDRQRRHLPPPRWSLTLRSHPSPHGGRGVSHPLLAHGAPPRRAACRCRVERKVRGPGVHLGRSVRRSGRGLSSPPRGSTGVPAGRGDSGHLTTVELNERDAREIFFYIEPLLGDEWLAGRLGKRFVVLDAEGADIPAAPNEDGE